MRNLVKKSFAMLLTLCILCISCKEMNVYAAGTSTYKYSTSTPIGGSVMTLTSGLSVRQQPNTSSTIVATLAKQSNIMIVGESGNFWLVQYDYAGHTGYASKDYISANTNAKCCWRVRDDITGSVNFRMGPGTEYQSITGLAPGTFFAYNAVTNNGWGTGIYAISYGYASCDFIYPVYF